MHISSKRRITNSIMLILCGLMAVCGGGILLVLLLYVLINGISYVNWDFVTQLPAPLGQPGGGMVNAFVGTFIMVGIASIGGITIGVGVGIYLSEFAGPRMCSFIRFMADVLTGVPSIIIGIFAYTLIVLRTGSFSAWAGAFALGIIMLPIVARTTEESLRLVPSELREASLALGIPRWRTILSVVAPTAIAGLVTGILLAIARIAGETAPLLFTALGNRFWHEGLDSPMAALTLNIYYYAISPYESWHQQAWAASFFLLMIVLIISILSRIASTRAIRR